MLIMQQIGADDDADGDEDNRDTSGGIDDNACDQDRIPLPNLNPMWSCGISVTRSFTCATSTALLALIDPLSPSLPNLACDLHPLATPSIPLSR